MTRTIFCMMVATLLWALPTQASPLFTLLPEAGSDVAAPGATIGWGYEITNDDTTDWLVISSFNADLVQYGSLTDIFDYPILAPGSTVTTPYLTGLQGLAEFTWDALAPAGFTNTGLFTIGAQFWDGDPFAGGAFVSALPDFTAAFDMSTAPETPTPTPEPSSLLLVSTGLAGVAAIRWRRGTRTT